MNRLQIIKTWFHEHFSSTESAWAYRFAYDGTLGLRMPQNFYFLLTPSWFAFAHGQTAAGKVIIKRLKAYARVV